jgi:hypothetical protein
VKAQVRASFTARIVGKCDEAHLLDHDQLEAVRMLTNDQMDAASPLAAIGQPPLRRMLRLGVLAALYQRIAPRYAIPAMTADEAASYSRPSPGVRGTAGHWAVRNRRSCRPTTPVSAGRQITGTSARTGTATPDRSTDTQFTKLHPPRGMGHNEGHAGTSSTKFIHPAPARALRAQAPAP